MTGGGRVRDNEGRGRENWSCTGRREIDAPSTAVGTAAYIFLLFHGDGTCGRVPRV